MKKLIWLTAWEGARHTKRLVFLRMALGILLFIKGIDFISDTAPLQVLLSQQKNLGLTITWLSFAVGWAQVSGGILIALGLFTRVACSLQLLIITVVLLIRFSSYTLSDYALLEMVTVLFGLILFLTKGGGMISLDRFFRFNQTDQIVFWA